MAKAVKLLIQQSYVFAEIIAEEGEQASATQLNIGLELLNIIIRETNITSDDVSLLTFETFFLNAGESTFDLPGWTDILKLQYLLGTVRFDIRLLTLQQFLNTARITTSSGIPYVAFPKRTPTGITLEIFFIPSTDYEMQVSGYKNLDQLTITDTISGNTDFLEDYFLFKLAYDIQQYYQRPPSPFLATRVKRFEDKLRKIKPKRIDMNVNVMDNDQYPSNIAELNLGRGWKP